MSIARPVTSLLRCALAAAPVLLVAGEAAVAPPAPASTTPSSSSTLTPPWSESNPGRSAVGAGRQVVVQGQIDLDLLQRDNYTDANSSLSDHRGYGTLRAELGLKVKLDDRATAVVGFGYRSDLGDYGPTNATPGPTRGPDSSQRNSPNSQVVLQDAYVNLKEFLSFEELGVIAGRMPVRWNLWDDRDSPGQRPERGSFLYDSQANNPAIGSWDGIRAAYSGFDTAVISPWIYKLPDASTLWGITLDWKPTVSSSGDKVFVTAMYTEERNIRLQDGTTGPRLKTYYGGLDWRVDDVGLWVEGASQRGDASENRKFTGWGSEGGFDWQYSEYGRGRFQIIGEVLSGDSNPSDGQYNGFVNKWESISDTLIVESEKYGELSSLLVGDLMAAKTRWGTGLDERNNIRFDTTLAYYRLDKRMPGGERNFGTELDLQLRWQYSTNTQINFFGGALKPGDGLRAAMANNGVAAAKDPIWLLGINLNMAF